MHRILIVEDDHHLRELLCGLVQELDCEVRDCASGREALRLLRLELPDLLILDRVLPDLDGMSVLKRLRQISQLPVLMLTALRSEEDKVAGLDAGADDYLGKPFGKLEFQARLRALLRRSTKATKVEFALGSLRLDRNGRRAWLGEQELTLTPLELKVIRLLLSEHGQVVSRDRLLEDAWGMDYDGFDRAVDALIKRLRPKLQGSGAPLLRTVRGQGYILDPPGEEE